MVKDSVYFNKSECKECCSKYQKSYQKTHKKEQVYRSALRRAREKQATPPWADLDKLKEIYKNCPEGYHVDHIFPLTNKLICGLHVPENLQYLKALDNLCKSNKFK